VPLKPDVVTYYQGFNENLPGDTEAFAGARKYLSIAWSEVAKRLLTVGVLNDFWDQWVKPAQAFENQVKAHTESHRAPFIRNVSRLHQEATQRGIVFIVATQQVQSLMIKDRTELRITPYEAKADLIKQKLDRQGWITMRERDLYTHRVLTHDLRQWASTNKVPFVDMIKIIDPERDVLLNWVHLSKRGNEIVAAAFAREIEKFTCR
jgi:hypothetical protein